MSINENIKNFRTFRDISQQQLADYLGVSKASVSNWERAASIPDADSCGKICKMLKVTPNELFGWEKCKEYEAWKTKVVESTERLNQIYQKINDMKKEAEAIEKDIASLDKIEEQSSFEIIKNIGKSEYDPFMDD